MSKSKNYWALVLNLANPEKPEVVESKDLFKLHPQNVAKRFVPKNDGDFQRIEYGRKVVIDDITYMVRHLIIDLNCDPEALKQFRDLELAKNKKRFVPPSRKSIEPIKVPIETYSFPEADKAAKSGKRKQNAETIAAIKKSKKTEGDKIMATFIQEEKSEKPAAVMDNDNARNMSVDDKSAEKDSEIIECDFDRIDTDAMALKRDEAISKRKDEDDSTASKESEEAMAFGGMKSQLSNIENLIQQMRNDFEAGMNVIDQMRKDFEASMSVIDQLQKDFQAGMTDMKGMLNDASRGNEKSGEVKVVKSKVSKLDNLSNCLSDDEEEVPPGKIKVGEARYVLRDEMKVIESRISFKTARISAICDIMFEGCAGQYSVKDGAENHISNYELKSICKIMEHMKWNYATDITFDKVRDRVIKHTSDLRKKQQKGSNGEESGKNQEEPGN